MNGDLSEKRTIYVGNLPPEVTEAMLVAVFAQFGQCVSCKIMRDLVNRSEPYAFIEFETHEIANMALNTMNHIKFMERELRVNWATSPAGGNQNSGIGSKVDKGFNVFVGDLAPEVDDKMILDAFKAFGPVYDAKIVRYQDGRSRGYAFVSFENEADAEESIKKMDRSWMVNKAMRVNWATRKPGSQETQQRTFVARRFEDVVNESSPSNTTVYCGGIQDGLTEELVKANFIEYGQILDVRIFPEKGYTFIRYDNHNSAAAAIAAKHGQEINGFSAKCSWGKDGFVLGSSAGSGSSAPASYPPNFNQPPPGMGGSSGGSSNNQSYDEYYKQYWQYYQQQQYYYQQQQQQQQYYNQYYNQGGQYPQQGQSGGQYQGHQQQTQSGPSGDNASGAMTGGFLHNNGSSSHHAQSYS